MPPKSTTPSPLLFNRALRLIKDGNYSQARSELEQVNLCADDRLSRIIDTYTAICRHKARSSRGALFFHPQKSVPILKEVISADVDLLDTKISAPAFVGDILKEDKVDPCVIINHFTQSPLQLTLIFCAAYIARLAGLEKQVYSSAAKSLAAQKLSYALLLQVFLSPQGLPVLRLLLEGRGVESTGLAKAFRSYSPSAILSDETCSPREFREKLAFLHANSGKILRISQIASNNRHAPDSLSKNPGVTAGSIFLNEAKYLQRNLFNHYSFVDEWILVEGACQGYPARKVDSKGISLDQSSVILFLFPDPFDRLHYIEHGWTSSCGEEAKCELRNEYIKLASNPFLAVIDIDEFYTDQAFSSSILKLKEGYHGVIVPQIHCWKSLEYFIIGGYYDVTHMRFFRISPDMRYVSNHNFPEAANGARADSIKNHKFERSISFSGDTGKWNDIYCHHMGFAKDRDDMKDKTDYYINRGEVVTRPQTTLSRKAWFDGQLPAECTVFKLDAVIPEVLLK